MDESTTWAFINSKCNCGEPIQIELNCHSTRTCRSDLKRPYYSDNDFKNSTTVFRCRSCSEPVDISVPFAWFADQ